MGSKLGVAGRNSGGGKKEKNVLLLSLHGTCVTASPHHHIAILSPFLGEEKAIRKNLSGKIPCKAIGGDGEENTWHNNKTHNHFRKRRKKSIQITLCRAFISEEQIDTRSQRAMRHET
ncbi:hypothetical protein POVCU2_0032340 [Plasmodium ovale curtisi]|uniref:Uncharacterized protein n=1 Tax=Plasmodium ovale curtisi TaxID=864141 RepID=A0A1A8WRR1_PLAOA|nr:hypothetical protein POVCU2_0032340 [Plasmodium ovale curtisi]SBS95608.1 hypothetical protein POVCU1_029850 [Plasmodium ovale curtisi]